MRYLRTYNINKAIHTMIKYAITMIQVYSCNDNTDIVTVFMALVDKIGIRTQTILNTSKMYGAKLMCI